jgi:hypothetical protein
MLSLTRLLHEDLAAGYNLGMSMGEEQALKKVKKRWVEVTWQ